jgi:hypothetical protein
VSDLIFGWNTHFGHLSVRPRDVLDVAIRNPALLQSLSQRLGTSPTHDEIRAWLKRNTGRVFMVPDGYRRLSRAKSSQAWTLEVVPQDQLTPDDKIHP